MRNSFLSAVLLTVLLVVSVSAGIPQLINYQGRLTDAVGDPVTDGAYLIRFQLYDDPSAGSTKWSSGVRQVDVADGLFTYPLGDTVALPDDLFANDTGLWLGVKVGADPEMTPRTRLTAYGFAYQALRADTAGIAATVYDNAITSGKIADGSVDFADIGQNGASVGQLMKWNGSAWAPAADDAGTSWNWSDSSSHGPDSVLFADTAGIAATVYDNAVTSAKIATGAVASDEIADGTVQEIDLAFDPATQAEMDSHQSNASAHHTKTTSASELTSGALADARLSSNVVMESISNTFTGGTNSFNNTLKIGDSTFQADNNGIRIGDATAPSGGYLVRIERQHNTGSARYGIYIDNENTSTGLLYGISSKANALTPGSGGTAYGVVGYGLSDGSSRFGLFGLGMAQDPAITTGSSYGLYGFAYDGATAYGVYASASSATTNWAGYFWGNVHVTGSLSKGGGGFKIDHPLDPENKYLQHSFVESPDMMNIYNGNVVTDAGGYATITLPDYFDEVNRDFRYQLTVIGGFAQAVVSDEISGNQFTIQTDKPTVKVSWQVTGVRKDKWAEANRIEVEMTKPEHEQGYYMHYEEWNQPVEKAVDREQLLEAQKMREEQAKE